MAADTPSPNAPQNRPTPPSPPSLPSPEERLAALLQRFDDSRRALRQELVPLPEPAGGPSGSPLGGLADPLRRWWRRLRRGAQRSPLAALAADAVQGWWQHHPWRPTAMLLVHQVPPLLQRHPVAAVALAAVAGAALVGTRPWRWPAVNSQLRPLPSRALHWALAQLGSAPVQTALASLALMAMRGAVPPASPPSPSPPSPSPSPVPAGPAPTATPRP